MRDLNKRSFFAAPSISMVQLSQAPFRCLSSPSGWSEEGEDKSMKAAKQQVNPSGENQPPSSPLQSALNSAASPSQAYETYIDNGLICLKHKIRNIEKKKVTCFSLVWHIFKQLTVKLSAYFVIAGIRLCLHIESNHGFF